MKHKSRHIDIDKLMNSIEDVITGDNFPTDVSLVENTDLKDHARVYTLQTCKPNVKIDFTK